MTKGHKHYIISTGRNHEYLLETSQRIFSPAELKVFTDFPPMESKGCFSETTVTLPVPQFRPPLPGSLPALLWRCPGSGVVLRVGYLDLGLLVSVQGSTRALGPGGLWLVHRKPWSRARAASCLGSPASHPCRPHVHLGGIKWSDIEASPQRV